MLDPIKLKMPVSESLRMVNHSRSLRDSGDVNCDGISRVTIIVPDLKGGGAQRVATSLVAGLLSRNINVSLVAARPSECFFRVDPRAVRAELTGDLVHTGGSRIKRLRGVVRRVVRWRRHLRAFNPDVIVSFTARTSVFAVFASKGTGIPVIASERNDPAIQAFKWYWQWLRPRAYRFADIVTANSEGALRTIARWVPGSKLELIRNSVSVPEFIEPYQSERPYFLAVGRLNRQKAFDVLLEAFARIAPEHPEFDLRFLGDGPEREALEAQAGELAISHRVHWHGSVDDPYAFMASAEVLVLPSRHEGVPNVVLEAMAVATPVIVSDGSSGPLEFVRDSENGLVVPVENVDRLAGAMRRIVRNKVLKQKLGRRARESVSTLVPERILDEWLRVLNRAIV